MHLHVPHSIHTRTHHGGQHTRPLVRQDFFLAQPKCVLWDPNNTLRARQRRMRKPIVHRPVGVSQEVEVVEKGILFGGRIGGVRALDRGGRVNGRVADVRSLFVRPADMLCLRDIFGLVSLVCDAEGKCADERTIRVVDHKLESKLWDRSAWRNEVQKNC